MKQAMSEIIYLSYTSAFASTFKLMNIQALLLMVIASLLGCESNIQTSKNMKAQQVTIRDNKVKINYYQHGQGDTTLLFIHGWCIDGKYWGNQLEYFSQSYNVYAIDLPGFGTSTADRTNWTVEEYANDVMAFIGTVGLENVVIVGHSMATEVMLEVALSNNPKVVGIVGVDNIKLIDVQFTPEQLEQMNAFFPQLQNDYKNAVVGYADMMLFHPKTSEEVKERVKTDFVNCDPVIGYETCINQVQYSAGDAQRLEQLNYKLHLINCDYFPTSEAGLKNHCKSGYQLEILPETGHYPMIEKPVAFNQALDKVLTGIK